MSLRRPVSDTISKIPDFGAVRQGFCWNAWDSDIKNSISKNSDSRPLQGVIHVWDAIWGGFGKVEKWAFNMPNSDIAIFVEGRKIFIYQNRLISKGPAGPGPSLGKKNII